MGKVEIFRLPARAVWPWRRRGKRGGGAVRLMVTVPPQGTDGRREGRNRVSGTLPILHPRDGLTAPPQSLVGVLKRASRYGGGDWWYGCTRISGPDLANTRGVLWM